MGREIIRDRQIIEDTWVRLDEADAAVPASGGVIVPLARWEADRAALVARGDVGVQLEGTDDVRALEGDLEHIGVIALHFPKFTDGRCYSHARVLREQLGYKGELRAVGDVLRDQLFVMARCGIDAFEMRADQDLAASIAAFETFSVRYQAASDQRVPAFRLR